MSAAHINFELFDSLTEQVETACATSGGLANAAHWIETHTRHPLNPAKPFSFEGHEYQRAILNDPHPFLAIRKSTQIGASELSARLSLAVCVKFQNTNSIYILPSIRFAQKYAMSRIDPIIEASPRLRALASREVSSNELKKIGSSFIYFTGAAQSSSAISIPARALYFDEYAFLDPNVASIFTSRLGHQKEGEKIVRYFSSPLHPHSDISHLYEQGTQNLYMCYHDKCGQWVTLEVLENMILPGFDDHLTNITYTDISNSKIQVDRAFIQCGHCHEPISIENMADPTRRAWVPRYPDREMASYDAGPLVLPQLRTPQTLLRDLQLYKNTTRWLQFQIGVPAEAASDMILQSTLDTCFTVPSRSPRSGGISNAVIGCDVGKTSHIAVGKQVGATFEVFWLDTVRQTDDNATGRALIDLYQGYNCAQAVIDAAPDVTMPKYVAGQLPYNRVWGCYFVRGRGKSNLASWELSEEEGVVKVSRTRALDEFVEAFNKGHIKLPAGLVFEEEIKQHLQRLKRVIDHDNVGEETAQWIATDPATHWLFCVFYAWLGQQILEDSGVGMITGLDLSRLVGKVRLQSTLSHGQGLH